MPADEKEWTDQTPFVEAPFKNMAAMTIATTGML